MRTIQALPQHAHHHLDRALIHRLNMRDHSGSQPGTHAWIRTAPDLKSATWHTRIPEVLGATGGNRVVTIFHILGGYEDGCSWMLELELIMILYLLLLVVLNTVRNRVPLEIATEFGGCGATEDDGCIPPPLRTRTINCSCQPLLLCKGWTPYCIPGGGKKMLFPAGRIWQRIGTSKTCILTVLMLYRYRFVEKMIALHNFYPLELCIWWLSMEYLESNRLRLFRSR
jgi:hypothetical protein